MTLELKPFEPESFNKKHVESNKRAALETFFAKSGIEVPKGALDNPGSKAYADAVRLAQEKLKSEGLYAKKVDGAYGDGTFSAISKYNSEHSLGIPVKVASKPKEVEVPKPEAKVVKIGKTTKYEGKYSLDMETYGTVNFVSSGIETGNTVSYPQLVDALVEGVRAGKVSIINSITHKEIPRTEAITILINEASYTRKFGGAGKVAKFD